MIQSLDVWYAKLFTSSPLVTMTMFSLYMLMDTLAAASSAVGQYEENRGINKDRKRCELAEPVWIRMKNISMVLNMGKWLLTGIKCNCTSTILSINMPQC
jgi:hypothetical protein